MAGEYKLRQEVLDFMASGHEEGEGPVLCAGRNTYTMSQIIEEAKKGTPFGKKLYEAAEASYDEIHSEKPDMNKLRGKLTDIIRAHKKK